MNKKQASASFFLLACMAGWAPAGLALAFAFVFAMFGLGAEGMHSSEKMAGPSKHVLLIGRTCKRQASPTTNH
jgi:hypothetical protein